MGLVARLLFCTAFLIAVSACRPEPATPDDPSREPATVDPDPQSVPPAGGPSRTESGRYAPPTVEPESKPTPPPLASAEMLDLVARATERQKCNRVMGCPAGEKLVRIGEDAVEPIMTRYREMPGWSYQRIHLLELLGRMGSGAPVELLVAQLDAPSWDARAQAAIALGRIGAKDRLAHLRSVLEDVGEKDRGFQYALAFAVEKLGGIGGKDLLMAGLEGERVANTNWGYTTVAAAAVGELGVAEACPLLVHSLRHRDIFLIKAALASASALGCRDLQAEIKKLLDSPIPSVRREANRALAVLSTR